MARRKAVTSAGFVNVFEAVSANVGQALAGKDEAIRLACVCFAAGGHLLIEDVPGVGKTTLAKALAASFDCEWNRIQFTPDLLPSDVTGVTVFSRTGNRFEFRPGGVFANVVLADEINRASRRRSPRCSRRWRSARSPWTRRPIPCPIPSWSSPHRTRSSTKAPTRCRTASSTASCSVSAWATPAVSPRSTCSRTTRRTTRWWSSARSPTPTT